MVISGCVKTPNLVTIKSSTIQGVVVDRKIHRQGVLKHHRVVYRPWTVRPTAGQPDRRAAEGVAGR